MTIATIERTQSSRSKQLARQMRKWREALPRCEMGLPGSKRFVTQEEAAVLCGTAVSHYGNLERGRVDLHYSDEVLDTVARVLRLGEVSRKVLYLLASGREPKPIPYPEPYVCTATRARLACQPWPAFALDPMWNILESNAAMVRWFPHLATETNWMRFWTCHPSVREQLVDWETVWLPRAIAQLKGALAWPERGDGLEELATFILNSCPQAREWMYGHPMVWMYSDGDERQLVLPGASEPTTVVMSTDAPTGHGGTRLAAVVPIGGYIPDDCRPYLPQSLTVDGGTD